MRRLSFRDAENRPVAVFAVTMLGYSVARQLLRRPPSQPTENVTASFLARTVRLNDELGEGAFGMIPAQAIAAVKQRGMLLAGTATTVEEAIALAKAGVDVVVAQGSEAGGIADNESRAGDHLIVA